MIVDGLIDEEMIIRSILFIERAHAINWNALYTERRALESGTSNLAAQQKISCCCDDITDHIDIEWIQMGI